MRLSSLWLKVVLVIKIKVSYARNYTGNHDLQTGTQKCEHYSLVAHIGIENDESSLMLRFYSSDNRIIFGEL